MIKKIKKLPCKLIVSFLLACLVVAIVMGLKIGYVEVDWKTIVYVLLNKTLGLDVGNYDPGLNDIIWELRLPRILLAAAVGMGLSLSGIVMQATIQNPLADPYILGISSGASLGATAAIFLGVGSIFGAQSIGVCAFIGAIGVSWAVIFVSNRGNKNNAVRLLLTGVAVGAVCGSISSFIVYIGKNKEGMEAITYWLMGNVANARLSNVLVLLLLVGIIYAYFLRQTRVLNLMLVGEDTAATLGISLKASIKKFLLLNGLLVGFMVYNAGMIGFVGLVIPHIVRSIFGANHKKLVPVAFFLGGLVAVLADILSRTLITGVEIPLGVVFSLIGAPFFIYLMLQKRYRFGG